VRAGLVEKPEDWRWSSYNFYAFGKVDSLIGGLIDVDPYYLQLGGSPEERQKGYRQNIEGVMKEKFLKDIREELNQGVFGSPNFITTVKEKFKIRSLKRRGRPRKEEK
jgi:putative transposase